MRSLTRTAVFMLLAFPIQAFASNPYPLAVHLKVTELGRAEAPQILNNEVIFSFKPKSQTRFVGIAFADEDFRTIHPFLLNQHGVYFYVLSLSPDRRTVVYRLVVDGLWRSDPNNPNQISDSSGIELSKVDIPRHQEPLTSSPIVNRDGTVQFLLRAPDNRTITVAGDFNHWDPFMDRMKEIRKGVYSITLRVGPGTHAYYYVSDGTTLPDPLNSRIDYFPDGAAVSVFTMP